MKTTKNLSQSGRCPVDSNREHPEYNPERYRYARLLGSVLSHRSIL
jgi:hypothetical protein